jgi:hypothetical protein
MFSLFSSPKILDPQLGELARSRGYWRGFFAIGPYIKVPLAVIGNRSAPDPTAIAAARELATLFPIWSVDIARALFDHYSPFAEAVASGEIAYGGGSFPKLASPSGVWPLVSLSFASVAPISGLLTIELGVTAEWDEEHILGARFQDGKLIELCGSTVPA